MDLYITARRQSLVNLAKKDNSKAIIARFPMHRDQSANTVQGHGRTVERIREARSLGMSGGDPIWSLSHWPDAADAQKACKQRPDKPVAILLDTKAGTLSTENVTLLQIDNPGQLEYTQEAEQKSENKNQT